MVVINGFLQCNDNNYLNWGGDTQDNKSGLFKGSFKGCKGQHPNKYANKGQDHETETF